jgi:nucleotide-binding universal stress UspA family protein
MIKKILVPIEFADPSHHALEYAIALARRLDASILLVHAYEIPVYGIPDGALVATAEAVAHITSAAQQGLDAAIERCLAARVPATGELRLGRPVDVILEVAREAKADLIAMGTHGRKGVARAFLGSVAEAVVRSSPRPVLTLREEGKAK